MNNMFVKSKPKITLKIRVKRAGSDKWEEVGKARNVISKFIKKVKK